MVKLLIKYVGILCALNKRDINSLFGAKLQFTVKMENNSRDKISSYECH